MPLIPFWFLISLRLNRWRWLLLEMLGYYPLFHWWASPGPWTLYESWQALVDDCSHLIFIIVSFCSSLILAFISSSLFLVCFTLLDRCQQLIDRPQP